MVKENEEIQCHLCQTRNKSVFCILDLKDVQVLNLSKRVNSFKKDHLIFQEGNYTNAIYCVNKGKIKISKIGIYGKEQIVRLAKEGDLLGYRSLLSGEKYTCTATTLENCSVCVIPKDAFYKLIDKNTNLSKELLKLISKELKVSDQKVTDIVQKPVVERIAEALLFVKGTYGFEEDGSTINVSLKRDDIANIAGVTQTTAVRLLSKFKDEKIIEYVGKKIKILNNAELANIANIVD